jgi:hypothetical protein
VTKKDSQIARQCAKGEHCHQYQQGGEHAQGYLQAVFLHQPRKNEGRKVQTDQIDHLTIVAHKFGREHGGDVAFGQFKACQTKQFHLIVEACQEEFIEAGCSQYQKDILTNYEVQARPKGFGHCCTSSSCHINRVAALSSPSKMLVGLN